MSDHGAGASGRPLPTGPTSSGRDWLGEARQAFRAADPERAIYAAREALTFDGRNAEAWAIRARSSWVLERYQDAEFEAKEAVRLEPHIGAHHDMLADVYRKQQRYDDALREANDAVRLEPGNPDWRETLAGIHVAKGEPRKAVSILEQLTKEVPGEPLYRRLLASALDMHSVSMWTELPDGDRIITSAAQVRITRENTRRALALEFQDNALRQQLKVSLNAADVAERKRWLHTSHPRAYVGGIISPLIVGLVTMFSGSVVGGLVGFLLVLVAAGVVWVYVARHYKFVWEHDAELVAQLTGRR